MTGSWLWLLVWSLARLSSKAPTFRHGNIRVVRPFHGGWLPPEWADHKNRVKATGSLASSYKPSGIISTVVQWLQMQHGSKTRFKGMKQRPSFWQKHHKRICGHVLKTCIMISESRYLWRWCKARMWALKWGHNLSLPPSLIILITLENLFKNLVNDLWKRGRLISIFSAKESMCAW